MEKTILILDDQKDLLSIMEREFRRRNDFVIHSAKSIAEAVDVLAGGSIKLVVSDVRLGEEESGFIFAATLNQQYPGTGLILMSAYRSPANRQQAEALGAFLFLEKPFTMAKLIGVVDDYFVHREALEFAAKSTDTLPSPATASGSLSHFKAQDLVQLFCLNGRAIVISVKERQGSKAGTIHIQRGQVLHAEMGDLSGDAAFHQLVVLSDAELSVSDWDRAVPQTITSSWEHLLLVSAVQSDHGNEEFFSKAG